MKRAHLLSGDDLPEHGDDLVGVLAGLATGQQPRERRPRGRREAQDGLEAGAALRQTLARVGLREEHRGRDPVRRRLEPAIGDWGITDST